MIIHKEICLIEQLDEQLGGSVHAVLFEDGSKYGWFIEFRGEGVRCGKGTIGETSKLFNKLSSAKGSLTKKIGRSAQQTNKQWKLSIYENFSNSSSK